MLTNIQINTFQLTGQIGSGSYGLVFHAVDLITDGKYAIKAVMKQQPSAKAGQGLNDNTNKFDSGVRKSAVLQTQLYHFFKSFQNRVFLPVVDLNSIKSLTEKQLENAPHYREVSMHIAVHSHNNIVTIHQVLESSLAIFIVMDYHPCDLFTSIVNKQHFAENGMLVKKVFLQLCSAVLHCHRVGIYHCDIKPENILIDDQDNIYICDFGLATTATELAANVCVGSSYYMPPERICGGNSAQQFRTELGDIWSIGIILINLTCIRNPWLKADQTLDSTFRYFLRDSSVIKKILPISDELYQILCTVLQVDPLLRADISSLMEAVSNCEHFTTHGPLQDVAPLTVEQYSRFVEGDYAVFTRNSLEEYYSDYLGDQDECQDDSEQDLREDGITSYLEEDLLEDYDTSTGGSLTVPQLHKNSTGLGHHISLDCLQLSLSTDTNFSGFSRWLPDYSTRHEYRFHKHIHD